MIRAICSLVSRIGAISLPLPVIKARFTLRPPRVRRVTRRHFPG
jgi:hypothetical protein